MSGWWIALACAGPPSDPGSDRGAPAADVVSVRATGEPGAYTLFVTLSSADLGCEQYADWWEVVDADGALVYRRVLTHSHVDEQPFERSGGPVALGADDEVIVRGHLHATDGGGGYVGQVLRGSVAGGFDPWEPPGGFGADLAAAPPLPEGCRF